MGAGGSHTIEPYTPHKFVLNNKIGELKARITETESLLEEKENKLVDAGTLLEQKEEQINNIQKRSVNKCPKFQENVKQIEEIPAEVCGSIFLGKEVFGRKSGKKTTGKEHFAYQWQLSES